VGLFQSGTKIRYQGQESAKRKFALAVMIPIFIYMVFWTILPYLWVLGMAFFEYSPRRVGGSFLGLGVDNPFIGIQHFRNMLNFSDSAPRHVKLFHTAFKNTLLFSAVIVPVNLAITIPLAVMVNGLKRRRISNVFRTIFFTPVIASAVGVGVIWGYVFNPQRGILNHVISTFAGERIAISWLRDANLQFLGIPIGLIAVMVAYLWFDLGYNFVIYIAGLQNIPGSVVDASRVDGASPLQRFFRITLPLLRPQILLTSILTMISAFQVFEIVQVMTTGGPNNRTRVLILDIFDNAFRQQRMGWASAASIVLFLVVLLISILQKRLIRQDWDY
jgi:multiple sugar transport system permease protein